VKSVLTDFIEALLIALVAFIDSQAEKGIKVYSASANQ
jgi:hypothetical protein